MLYNELQVGGPVHEDPAETGRSELIDGEARPSRVPGCASERAEEDEALCGAGRKGKGHVQAHAHPVPEGSSPHKAQDCSNLCWPSF